MSRSRADWEICTQYILGETPKYYRKFISAPNSPAKISQSEEIRNEHTVNALISCNSITCNGLCAANKRAQKAKPKSRENPPQQR